jgi:hypothetical protein
MLYLLYTKAVTIQPQRSLIQKQRLKPYRKKFNYSATALPYSKAEAETLSKEI